MRSLFGNLHTPSSLSPLSGQPPGRPARGSGLFWLVVCLLAGWLQAAALAWPVHGWSPPGLAPGEPSGWLQIGSLSLLVLALRHVQQLRQGVWRTWVFATAWLVSTFWWLFVSMHTYGGLPAWLAALAVLALAGLAGVVLGDMQVRLIGVAGYAVVFPISAALLALRLHREHRAVAG
jgi:apolipoprotein N-acyltransferase